MADTVLYEASDGVATVTLNRPHRLNAIGDDLLDRLLDTLERVASDDDVRAMVLTGAGRGFCPGADVASLAGASDASTPDPDPDPDPESDPDADAPVPFHSQVGRTRRW